MPFDIHHHVDLIVEDLRAILGELRPLGRSERGTTPEEAIQRCTHRLEMNTQRAKRTQITLPETLLIERYALSSIEIYLLWLVLLPHLESEGSDWIARANDNILRDHLDLSLATRILCSSRNESAKLTRSLSPEGTLNRAGLLHLRKADRDGANRLYREIIPHEQCLHLFMGTRILSENLAKHASLVTPQSIFDTLPRSSAFASLLPIVERFYQRTPLSSSDALGRDGLNFPAGFAFIVEGSPGAGRSTLLKSIAASLGRRLILLDGRSLSAAPLLEGISALEEAFFESELHGDLLCIRDASELVREEQALLPNLTKLLQRRRIALGLCLCGGDAVAAELSQKILFKKSLDELSEGQNAVAVWRANTLEDMMDCEEVDFGYLTQRINLQPLQIQKAAHLSYLSASPKLKNHEDEYDAEKVLLDTKILERSALSQIPRSIGGFATVSEPSLSIKDLIADAETEHLVEGIVAAARNRRKVLYDWKLSTRIRRGTGLVVLFDGDPGTGKTHAAEIIAGELGLSLVRINVAGVVDKYIGETEKNLTQIFSRARPDISLLLFDEADSLFAKRTSNVSKSTDRYSNMNINVLLQLIENYEGISVLTTNIKRAIDPAFERRFAYKIHFKMPEQRERERIWHYLLPECIKTAEEIDFEWLSEIELSGGEIKNAILQGAYHAARMGVLLNTEYLFETAQREASAAGRMVRREPRKEW